jgi:hypothetical protein
MWLLMGEKFKPSPPGRAQQFLFREAYRPELGKIENFRDYVGVLCDLLL